MHNSPSPSEYAFDDNWLVDGGRVGLERENGGQVRIPHPSNQVQILFHESHRGITEGILARWCMWHIENTVCPRSPVHIYVDTDIYENGQEFLDIQYLNT